MKAPSSYFKVGVFALVAVLLVAVVWLALRGGAPSRKAVIMESYFDGSVQGLEVGSPVKLRGVQLGQVEAVAFVDDYYHTDRRYILVRYSVRPFRELSEPLGTPLPALLEREIAKGLRLRLTGQGIAGAAFLEADYVDPNRNPPLPIDWKPGCLYLPSAPSSIACLGDAAGVLLRRLEQMELEQMVLNASRAMESLAFLMTNDVQPMLQFARQNSTNMVAEMAALSAAAQGVMGRDLPQMVGDVRGLTCVLSNAVVNADHSIRRIESIVDSQRDGFGETVRNARDATAELRDLIRNARQNPSQILFGTPPPERAPGR